eukprot:3631565-Pleurochrysis_carterae.AAC.1
MTSFIRSRLNRALECSSLCYAVHSDCFGRAPPTSAAQAGRRTRAQQRAGAFPPNRSAARQRHLRAPAHLWCGSVWKAIVMSPPTDSDMAGEDHLQAMRERVAAISQMHELAQMQTHLALQVRSSMDRIHAIMQAPESWTSSSTTGAGAADSSSKDAADDDEVAAWRRKIEALSAPNIAPATSKQQVGDAECPAMDTDFDDEASGELPDDTHKERQDDNHVSDMRTAQQLSKVPKAGRSDTTTVCSITSSDGSYANREEAAEERENPENYSALVEAAFRGDRQEIDIWESRIPKSSSSSKGEVRQTCRSSNASFAHAQDRPSEEAPEGQVRDGGGQGGQVEPIRMDGEVEAWRSKIEQLVLSSPKANDERVDLEVEAWMAKINALSGGDEWMRSPPVAAAAGAGDGESAGDGGAKRASGRKEGATEGERVGGRAGGRASGRASGRA